MKYKEVCFRALKTTLQTILGMWTAGALITELDWKSILIASISAGAYSLLMNIIPLIPCEESENDNKKTHSKNS